MTRSILDHAEPEAEGSRVREFLDIERREGLHPAVQDLSQRPAGRSGRKVQEFLRIDREEAKAKA
jgi:hypothetical protein